MLETRQLEYFLVVADELHFGRAAERLHIVQSAVSQQIRALERELGVSLFDRTTRSVALTEAGRRLVPHAEKVLVELREISKDLGGPDKREVRLGTSTGLGARLDRILDAFAAAASGARIELVRLPAATRARQVKSGVLDAAILRSARHEAGLDLLALWEERLMAVLPVGDDLACQEEVEMAQLAGTPLRLVSRSRNPDLFDLVTGACREAGFDPILGPEFSNDQDTLAAIGHGPPSWTVYFESQTERLAVPGVAFVPFSDPQPTTTVHLAVRSGHRSPDVDALIQACRDAGD